MLHYRELFLFNRRVIVIPADAEYVLVQDNGDEDHINVASNVDDIKHDAMLHDALYSPEVA